MAAETKSLAQRARELGISEQALRKRMANKDEPELLKWRERKERAEALKAEKFLDMIEGNYLPRDEVDVLVARVAHVCNALLRAIPAELAPLVAGLTPARVEKVAKEWTGPWSEKLADAESDVWTGAEKAIQREMRGDAKKVAAAQARKKK